MSMTSGFFDARLLDGGSYDRDYDAADFAAYFSSLIGNGLIETDDNEGLSVVPLANPSMNVVVKPGRAFINGYWFENDSEETLAIETPDDTLDRYDIVVVRLDLINRACELLVRTGTPASSPVPPTLQRNVNYYELQLAQIYVQHGYLLVVDSRIIDTRPDEDLCGFVKGVGDGGGVETAYIVGSIQFAESWLAKTVSGNPFTPKANTLYLILTDGYYYYHTYTWDSDQGRYMQVAAPIGRLTADEVETLWNQAGIDAYIDNTPTPVYTDFVYDGQSHTQSFLYVDPEMMTVSGDMSGVNAGVYTTIFTPINGYAWADTRTMEARSVQWSIAKLRHTKPTLVKSNYNYTGSLITIQLNDYDSNYETIYSNTGTAMGDYEAVISLTDTVNHAWSDGTIAAISLEWHIIAASPEVTLNKYSVSLTTSSTTDTVTVTRAGSGVITVSGDSSIATVSVNGTTVTFTRANNAIAKSSTFFINVAASGNYAAESVVLAVSKDGINIVTFAEGTDAEIAAMIDAAQSGDITLSDYWSVGDKRIVSISGVGPIPTQTAEMVLLGSANRVPAAGDSSKVPSFVVGFTHSLCVFPFTTSAYQNNDGSFIIFGWHSTINGYVSCLPSIFSARALTCTCRTTKYSKSSQYYVQSVQQEYTAKLFVLHQSEFLKTPYTSASSFSNKLYNITTGVSLSSYVSRASTNSLVSVSIGKYYNVLKYYSDHQYMPSIAYDDDTKCQCVIFSDVVTGSAGNNNNVHVPWGLYSIIGELNSVLQLNGLTDCFTSTWMHCPSIGTDDDYDFPVSTIAANVLLGFII